MASPQTANGSRKMRFKAGENFDVKDLPPALPAGKWDFMIKKVTVRATKKKDPMLSMVFEVEGAHEEENESLVGKTVDEMVIFYSNDDPDANPRAISMHKVRLRQLCESAGIELDTIPTRWSQSGEELDEFANSLKGAKLTAWTTVQTNEDTGESRTNISYTEPGGGLTLSAAEEEEEEEKPAAKKGAKKAGRR